MKLSTAIIGTIVITLTAIINRVDQALDAARMAEPRARPTQT